MGKEDQGCLCQQCDNYFKVDLIVPNRVWHKIRPEGKPKEGGLLCGSCIMKKVEELGEFGAYELRIEDRLDSIMSVDELICVVAMIWQRNKKKALDFQIKWTEIYELLVEMEKD